MGLFGGKPKPVPIDTQTEYKNNITTCLEMYKKSAIKDRYVYLKATIDPKFINIYVSGIAEVAGTISRDQSNIVTNIGLDIGRGCLNAFTPDSEGVVSRYDGKPLDQVPPAFK